MPLECHCGGKKLSRLQKDTKHKNIAKNNKLFIIFKGHIGIENVPTYLKQSYFLVKIFAY